MPIDAICKCGKRLRVKDELAGKRVKCPACGKTVGIPAPAEEAAQTGMDDLLDDAGLPPLPGLDLDDSAFPAAASAQGDSPLGPAKGGGKARRPAGNLRQAKSKKSDSGITPTMWMAMGGGALLAVIGIVVVSLLSGGDEVASGPEPAAPAVAQPSTVPAPPSDPTAGASDGSITSSAGPLPAQGAAETPVQPAGLPTTAPAAKPATPPVPASSLSVLQPAIDSWRSKPEPRRGMQPFPDKMRVLGYSWLVELLPYLGEDALHKKFDFSKSWSEPVNLQFSSASIPAFLNPAEPRTHWKGYPFENMGLTHYVGMSGVEDARNVVAAELPRSDPRAGVFGYDAVARPAEITDGTSQTIMVLGSGNLVSPWVQGGGATIRGARAPYFDEITGFGSKGLAKPGTQVLFADGSVRAISADIDPAVFKSMCTIHGEEIIDTSSINFQPPEVNAK